MSLYDDASLVMIPSAIEDGKLYNVKPKPIPISGELITNGTFDTDSDWLKLNATISGGKGNLDGDGQTSLLYQNILTQNKSYKVTFTVSNYNGLGEGKIINSNGDSYYTITENGSFTVYFKHIFSDGLFYFRAINGAVYSIDNVSVKEVGQNWTFGTGWNMGDGKAVFSGTDFANLQPSSSLLTIGKKYKLSLTAEVTNGSFKVQHPSSSDLIEESNSGSYSAIFVATANTFTIARASVGVQNDFSIDNVSVIEITDDTDLPRINYTNFDYEDVLGDELVTNGSFSEDSNWTKGSAWSIANGQAIFDDSTNSSLTQSKSFDVGKKYRINFEIKSGSGSIAFLSSNGVNTYVSYSTYNVGTHTADFVYSSGSGFGIFGSSFLGGAFSIDNVSVKELTENVVVPYSGTGSLKLEPQSTNLALNSNDLTKSTWSKFNSTSGSSNIINPEGTSGASEYVCNNYTGSNQYFRISQNTTYSSDVNYSYSVFVKYKTFQFCKLTYVNFNSLEHFTAVFDIINGIVTATDSNGTPQNTSANIQDFGNGWFRISISAAITSSAGNAMNFEFNKCPSGTPTFTSFGRTDQTTTTSDRIYVWGAQLEQQSYATSYIPTSGSTVTRLADVCINAGSSDLINSTEGILYAEISSIGNDGVGKYYSISDGTSSNRIRIGYSFTDNTIRALVVSQGSSAVDYTHTISDVKSFSKVGFSYKQNEFSFWIDGVKVYTDTSGNTPTGLNSLQFDNGVGGGNFYGNVKTVAVFKEALDNDQLERLTGEGYETFNLLAQANNYTII